MKGFIVMKALTSRLHSSFHTPGQGAHICLSLNSSMAPASPTHPTPPLDAAVSRALALLDALTDPARSGDALRSADLDAAAAVCFVESWRAGLGLVCGAGHGFVIAKVREMRRSRTMRMPAPDECDPQPGTLSSSLISSPCPGLTPALPHAGALTLSLPIPPHAIT